MYISYKVVVYIYDLYDIDVYIHTLYVYRYIYDIISSTYDVCSHTHTNIKLAVGTQ